MASGLRITLIAVGALATSAAVAGAQRLDDTQLMIITPSLFGPQQALTIMVYCVFGGGVQYFWVPRSAPSCCRCCRSTSTGSATGT